MKESGRHLWISSELLTRLNLYERCNLGARFCWTIETGFLVEKHHGYQCEHCFSYDWNVMKGYQYLMLLGHMFNTMPRYSKRLAKIVIDTGIKGLIRFGKEPFTGWLYGLHDIMGRKRILARFTRLQQGNYGDCEPVGEGVSELRLFFGLGYRVYFGEEEMRTTL